MLKIKLIILATLVAAVGVFVYRNHQTDVASTVTTVKTTSKNLSSVAAKAKQVSKLAVNMCASNRETKAVIVNISQQHMWSCNGTDVIYQTAVTTGATKLGNATPTGTWQVYAKQTDRYLSGSDSHGSWNDHVNYWMPYDGDFGFHDATWQTLSFGSPKYTSKGSHGCVRLPLAAMKWLYNWAPVGTTITIES